MTANSIHVMRMAAAFSDIGLDVHLFAQRGLCSETDIFKYYGTRKTFTIHQKNLAGFPKIKVFMYSAACAAHAALLLKKNDIYYGRDPLALALLGATGIPVAYETHGLPPTPLARRVENFLMKSGGFKGIVAISNTLKRYYLANHPRLSPQDILVAHDAADDTGPPPPPPHNTSGNRLRVGYVGSLYQGRGIELILSLAARQPDVDFVLIGGPPEQIAHYKKGQPPNNVLFLGHIKPAEIPDAYGNMDILLAPYARKVHIHGDICDTSAYMSPLKLFEYMAAGRPFIASRMPAIEEIVQDGECCLLAEPENLEDWDRALTTLKDSPELREKLAQRGRERFLRHHTWKIRAANILSHLERCHAKIRQP